MTITFVTSNAAKAAEVSRVLVMPLEHQGIDIPELQSVNMSDVVRHKAQQAFASLKRPLLVEDTALTFHALGHLPGPFIKWFFQELGNDGLCQVLNNFASRDATASVMFGLHDGTAIHLFEAHQPGTIASTPRGGSGFGWDPLFIPQGHTQTWGEMTPQKKEATSMRTQALNQVAQYLKNKV